MIILLAGKPTGRIGIHHLHLQNESGAIGYWLGQQFQGKGIITRCCVALINYGFDTMLLNRIEIKASVDNEKSQAIPKRLNFAKERLLRQAEKLDSGFTDLNLFAMLRQDGKS